MVKWCQGEKVLWGSPFHYFTISPFHPSTLPLQEAVFSREQGRILPPKKGERINLPPFAVLRDNKGKRGYPSQSNVTGQTWLWSMTTLSSFTAVTRQ